ncbi:hypothetical protein GO308_09725 [Sphingomonas sp. SFZ2018-12]|uniref:hypothetical protein n=1 Tax=Sphingomonas sp. SFZ2018-12 TaxID=2683197 RepID=UPI001F102C2A|nr:hypothetical protein [Sphingomonas sp. SFZ2018-12]MCH4893387.1 hypothetical protein [Sphingomonas sp. SFZ2018-12]
MDQKKPRIRLFRPGTFTSNEGRVVSLTEADLAAIAAAYDPSADPAPLVIGHPRLNDPAYGWVGRLAVEDGELVADELDRVEPSFAETVREGRYAKVSAQFYMPGDPNSPKPDTWYLRHIGFLGAKAPGVKGLGTVQFDDQADGLATLDFPNPPAPKEPGMSDKDLASFAEKEKALGEREAAIAAREKAARDAEIKARHDAHVSFAESLVKEAKLAPAGKPLLVGVLDALDADGKVSFGEAGELTPADALKKLLDGAQPLVSLAEIGKPEKDATEAAVASFAAPDGYDVDPKQAALFAKARAMQAEHPELAWMDAVRRAQAA